ncbi:hypothetical protein KEH51_24775 [[Brevibacterium] frigoritolerans]|uniref:Uncharacterized protein n=1 Tax=Peribacillus frigoritolerans TaxID=450367 RepID=A0A941JBQ0_9BACI|nr:hypothetical protein [Peribacillus frigoritolerans]
MIAVICAVFFGSILGLIAVKTITKEKAEVSSVETLIQLKPQLKIKSGSD